MTYKQALNRVYKAYPDRKREIYLMPSRRFWALFYRLERKNGLDKG